jgi:hypothetical protein
MTAVITAVMIGVGLLALAIWIEIREGPAATGDGITEAPGSHRLDGQHPALIQTKKFYFTRNEM